MQFSFKIILQTAQDRCFPALDKSKRSKKKIDEKYDF